MASIYEEGLQLIDEKFGNGKDNIISLATIARVLTEILVRLSVVWMHITKTAPFMLLHMENQTKCYK